MRWKEIAHYKASGHKDGTLTDTQNAKLMVVYSLLSAGRNRELRNVLAPRLAPLRERQLRDIGILNTLYRPNRGQFLFAGALILALGAFFLVGGLAMLTGKSPDHVTRTTASKGNNPNEIAFAFTNAQGRRVVGVSPVSYSEYRQAKIGDPLTVQYVPARPDLCRLACSISSRNATTDLVIAAFQLVFGGVVVPYLTYIALKKQSQAKTAQATIEKQ